MVLTFISHRPESLSFAEDALSAANIRLKALLLDEIISRAAQGYDTFCCGAACGMEIFFGEQVLWVKATTYPALRLICVVSRDERAEDWSERWRDRRTRLLERADEVTLVSANCALDGPCPRDRCMVNRADALLAVCDGSGTWNAARAMEYALEKAMEVVVIDPCTMAKSVIQPGAKD